MQLASLAMLNEAFSVIFKHHASYVKIFEFLAGKSFSFSLLFFFFQGRPVSGDTSTEEIVAKDISKPQAASEAARVVLRGPRRSRAGIEDDARDYASRPKLRPKDYGKGMRLLAQNFMDTLCITVGENHCKSIIFTIFSINSADCLSI